MTRYRMCGILLESEWELPAWRVTGDGQQAEVRICHGSVPETLEDAVERRRCFQTKPQQVLLSIPKVARYLLQDGREILIEPHPAASEEEVLTYLTGSALGALLHQRGVLPFHASTIRVNQSVVAFVGRTHAGKSTTAAACQQHGHTLLGDDICPVSVSKAGVAVSPGVRRLKLTEGAVRVLGLDSHRSLRRGPDGKLHFDSTSLAGDERLPLKRIYLLQDSVDDAPAKITPVHGSNRFAILRQQTYRYGFLNGLGLRSGHFQMCAAALKFVEIYNLWRPQDLTRLPETVEVLQQHWSQLVTADTRRWTPNDRADAA